MDVAGLVSVKVDADLGPLKSGLGQAEKVTRDFDKRSAGAYTRSNAEITKFGRNASGAAQRAAAANDNLAMRTTAVGKAYGSAIGPIKAFAAATAAAFSAGAIISASDAYTKLQNQIKLAGNEGKALADVQGRLFEVANKNGVAVQDLGTLYGRTALAAGSLGVKQQEILNLTEGVAAALRLGGRSASESSGALLQLSQALGAGTVRAEEFNSILEGAPEIARAAAVGLFGTADAVSQVRNRVIEGTLSSKEFFDALTVGLEQTKATAESLPLTIGQGMTILRNGFIAVVGAINDVTGAAGMLGNALGSAGAALTSAANGVRAFGAFLSPVAEVIRNVVVNLYDMVAANYDLAGAANVVGAAMLTAFGAAALNSVRLLALAIGGTLVKAFTVLGAIINANPIVRMVSIIAAIITAIYQWRDSLGPLGDAFTALWEFIRPVLEAVQKGLGAILEYLGLIKEEGANTSTNIDSAAANAAQRFDDSIRNASEVGAKHFSAGIDTGAKKLSDEFTTAAEKASEFTFDAHNLGGQMAGEAVAQGHARGAQQGGAILKAAGMEFTQQSVAILDRAARESGNFMATGARLLERAAQLQLSNLKAQNDLLKAQAQLALSQAKLANAQASATRLGGGSGGASYGGSASLNGSNRSAGSLGSRFGIGDGASADGRFESTAFNAFGDLGQESSEKAAETTASTETQSSVGVTIVNVNDPEQYVNAIGSAKGNQALVNFVSANAEEIRAILGVA